MNTKVENRKIVIPEAFVAALDLKEGDSVSISMDNLKQKIVINKELPCCIFCHVAVELIKISGKYICGGCRNKLSSAAVGDCLY